MAALKAGQVIRRLKRGTLGVPDNRLFRLRLVTKRVFSAESADDQWSGWGGPVAQLREGDTFERVSLRPGRKPSNKGTSTS